MTGTDQGFPQVLRIWGGSLNFDGWEGGLESIHRGEHGGLKMLLKNTCEGVHLLVKLPAISLEV